MTDTWIQTKQLGSMLLLIIHVLPASLTYTPMLKPVMEDENVRWKEAVSFYAAEAKLGCCISRLR